MMPLETTSMTESHHSNESSAARVVDAVREALGKTGYTWLQRVAVAWERECIALRGRVPSFYLKQLAHVTAMAVPGIGVVINELQVEGSHT